MTNKERAQRNDAIVSDWVASCDPMPYIGRRYGLGALQVRRILERELGRDAMTHIRARRERERIAARNPPTSDIRCPHCRGPKSPRAVQCRTCRHHRPPWTKETVIQAIHLFHERYGYVPASTDFNPTYAQKNGDGQIRKARYYNDRDYPRLYTVQRLFGSWGAALAAAGYPPNPKGTAGHLRWRGPDR